MIENKPSIYNGDGIYNGGGSVVEPSPFDFFKDSFDAAEKGVYQKNNSNHQSFNGNISTDNEIILDVTLEDLTTNRNIWCYLFRDDTLGQYISTRINPNSSDRVFSCKNGDPNPNTFTIPNGGTGHYILRLYKDVLEINGLAYTITYQSNSYNQYYLLPSKLNTTYYVEGNFLKQLTIKNGNTYLHDWVGCHRKYDNSWGLFDNVLGNYILSNYAGGV